MTALVRLVDDPSFDVSVALLTDTVLRHGALTDQEPRPVAASRSLRSDAVDQTDGDSEPELHAQHRRGGHRDA